MMVLINKSTAISTNLMILLDEEYFMSFSLFDDMLYVARLPIGRAPKFAFKFEQLRRQPRFVEDDS